MTFYVLRHDWFAICSYDKVSFAVWSLRRYTLYDAGEYLCGTASGVVGHMDFIRKIFGLVKDMSQMSCYGDCEHVGCHMYLDK